MTNVELPRTIATTFTANGTLVAGTHTPVDASSGTRTVSLPTPTHVGSSLSVEKRDASTNAVVIGGSIRGATTTISLAWQYETLTLRWSGSTWVPTEGHKTKASLDAAYGTVGSTVTNFGAVGDGVTDDSAAFRSALTAAGAGTTKVVRIPAGTYYLKITGSPIIPPTGVTLRGDGSSKTILLIDAASVGAYTEFVNFNNSNATIEGVTVKRAADFPCVMFIPGAVTDITLRDVTVDGQRDTFATNYCHGLQVGRQSSGTTADLLVENSTFTRLSYGLFQANASTGRTDGLTFRNCTFTANLATDLEFNAPNSTMTRVRVEDCNFYDNASVSAGAGFGVGLAHVTDAVISGCRFSGTYNNEVIHLEDWSSDVTISDNTFLTGGLAQGSVIQMISGVARVRVIDNSFNTTGNTAGTSVINVLAGGTGTTPGGRASIAPSLIEISDNDFLIAGTNPAMYLEVALYVTVTNNRFIGPGTVVNGSYAGPFSYAIRGFSALGALIQGNVFRKFTFGVYPMSDGNQSFGKGTVISGNTFDSCLLGLAVTNVDGVTVTDNVFSGCQYPMILSHGSYTNGDVVMTDNQAVGCTLPFGIYGYVQVTANGAASIGTAVTLATLSLPNVIPNGTVITFSGGGVLTTTGVAANIDGRAITGNLTTAAIANGETGYGYIGHSYSPGTFNRTLANNSDGFYGASGFGRRVVSTATSYRLDGHENAVVATASGITITMPPAANSQGFSYTVKNSSAGTVTVAAAGGTVETTSLAAGASVTHTSNGTNWLAF